MNGRYVLFFNQLKVGLCLTLLGATPASADDSFSIYGSDFIVIGDPGNRDTNDDEAGNAPGTRIGGVEYAYAIASKEVTLEQHLEFVIAYYPFYVKETGNQIAFSEFRGHRIRASFGQIHIDFGHEPDEPTDMSWEYAARYVNWLHHGKVIEAWAFESGVYDVSTFYEDDDGIAHHQLQRSPGARVCLPTLDEWTKAGYWDPSKDNGAGGYWRYPNASDYEPLPGFPDQGGERNAGDDDAFPLGVCSYPGVRSPWGLFDMAGGEREWTETARREGHRDLRHTKGSEYSDDRYGALFSGDLLWITSETSVGTVHGLRLGTPGALHPADLNADGRVDFFDVSEFVRWFIDGDDRADLRKDGTLDVDDVRVFLGLAEMAN